MRTRSSYLMRTNVSTVFNVGQAVARHMIGRGEGRIINIASVQAVLARPGIAPYTASKGAVANLTKGHGDRLGGVRASTSTRSRPAISTHR